MKRKQAIFFGVTPWLLGLDQLTKYAIQKHFYLGETQTILTNFFNLAYVQNTGAAFGLFAHLQPLYRIPLFILVPLFALACIGTLFWHLPDNDIQFSIALSLIISGAIGNLIDRLRFGYVVDFLQFHWHSQYYFPTFNVADSVICIGIAFLLLDTLPFRSSSHQGASSHVSSHL